MWAVGGISSSASDINDAGQIVGKFNITQEQFNPFVWQSGVMTKLDTLGFNGGAMSINNKGQVVGYSGLVFGITHAALWENGTIVDLGTLEGHNDSIAYDINDLGQAIGHSADKNTQQSKPVIWSNGKLTELKTLGGNVNYGVARTSSRFW
ncbi:hypothetical protein [Microcoleus sp. PH2017_02_FOX_O_A]|uniref:hypothetical protein n=1 Tax=Microcoleus sp. PH2017_02_FOX_O_A TaxID=2798813 RepID=UPI001D320A27|nr:hypothetical protein [Microcoleus sp. PH2017_02_FOX_O_A]MCC3413080.1 hypothetical protein [Microcoleus sp. PH2017_02_FOX_O_A]